MTSSASSTGSGPVSGFCGTIVRAAGRESESQPIGRRSESTIQGMRDLGPVQLRHLARRLPHKASGASQRSMSLDPHQCQALQRPVGSNEVLDEPVGGRHQELGRGCMLGQVPALLQHRHPVAQLIASSMSWVTKRTVFLISRWRRRNWFWSRNG